MRSPNIVLPAKNIGISLQGRAARVERTLIVARMNPDSAESVAGIFGESDAGELPATVGVTARSLFSYQGLYFHLIEAERPLAEGLAEARKSPLWTDINTKLDEFITPYDPRTWRGPADAMAHRFYSWRAV
ncbi:cyclase [Amycolatopsis pretoriensis]|uniref:Cyclase n=2 Tax=Amycolatopsis pretoriensis TaxID=218821 RepID=A0A1H5QEV6_9PSEU|nr:cyclase [Amycolatopsis pretoriensis]